MKHAFAFVAAALAAAGLWAGSAAAEPRVVGALTAAKDCPAYQAFRSGYNPGRIRLEVGKTYAVIGRNRPDDASYYRVIVEGATPAERWVGVECGFYTQGGPKPVAGAAPKPGYPDSEDLLLALSWQPAFCESKNNAGTECRNLTEQSYTADHFALHGLWPQGDRPGGSPCKGAPTKAKACNCPTSEQGLSLSPELKDKLLKIMPGAYMGFEEFGGFGAYEWKKHGSCYGAPQEHYFGLITQLVAQLNDAAPQKLFANNLGKAVTAEQIRAAFDDAFGLGAGARVAIDCYDDNGRSLIKDISINLRGPIAADSKLGDLIKAAPPARDNCARGVVDRVGLQ